MLLSSPSAHFILGRGHGWKFDKWNDFAPTRHERLFPSSESETRSDAKHKLIHDSAV